MVTIIPLKRFGITYWGVVIQYANGQSVLRTYMSLEGARSYVARLHPHLKQAA